jgi:hypothetical protein
MTYKHMTDVDAGVLFVFELISKIITVLLVPIWGPFWLIGKVVKRWE